MRRPGVAVGLVPEAVVACCGRVLVLAGVSAPVTAGGSGLLCLCGTGAGVGPELS